MLWILFVIVALVSGYLAYRRHPRSLLNKEEPRWQYALKWAAYRWLLFCGLFGVWLLQEAVAFLSGWQVLKFKRLASQVDFWFYRYQYNNDKTKLKDDFDRRGYDRSGSD